MVLNATFSVCGVTAPKSRSVTPVVSNSRKLRK